MAMPKHTTGKLDAPTATESGPTPERLRQGRVEQLDRSIADAAGRPGRPYRAVDTLMVMERRGSISAGMRQAGGISGALCGGAARSAARARFVASAHRRAPAAPRQ